MGKLGIIKNDNAIIDEFAIASWQATRRLKDRFEAIIFSLIRDYQKRELSGFREMKKKKSYVYDSRQSRGWKVATGEKTFCRGVIIMETDAYGRLYDASEEIFTMEHWFEREYCKNISKIFGRHLTRLCAWSYEDDWSLQRAKRCSAAASLLWKVMVYRCEWGMIVLLEYNLRTILRINS